MITHEEILYMGNKTLLEVMEYLNSGEFELQEQKTQRQTRNKLYEAWLVERHMHENLDSIYSKYYDDIAKNDFDRVITFDPTYKPERNRLGIFGKWLLDRFRQVVKETPDDKNAFSEFRQKFRDVKETLFDFENAKTTIQPPEYRDIGKYKTVEEIRYTLDNRIQLSAAQEKKRNKEAAKAVQRDGKEMEGARFIGENDEYEIWVPTEYATSCKLGAGTRWCTASTNSRTYWNQYSSSGTLYDFIPKNGDASDKFQVHIDNNGEIKNNAYIANYNDQLNIPNYGGKGVAQSFSTPEEFFAGIIDYTGTYDIVKKTELARAVAFSEVENMERVKKGEPYIYTGGNIPEHIKKHITIIKFHKDALQRVYKNSGANALAVRAFKGCESVKEIYLPSYINYIFPSAFEGVDENVCKVYTKARKINLPSKVTPEEVERMTKMFVFTKEDVETVDSF